MITTYVIGPDGRPTIEKGPNESLVYSWWFIDLLPVGSTVASVVSMTLASGLVAVGAPVVSAQAVSQRIAGGVLEKTLRARCVITSSDGDTIERSIWLAIVDR